MGGSGDGGLAFSLSGRWMSREAVQATSPRSQAGSSGSKWCQHLSGNQASGGWSSDFQELSFVSNKNGVIGLF